MEIDAGTLRTIIWIGLLLSTGIGTFLVTRYKINVQEKRFDEYKQEQKEQHIKEEGEGKARFDKMMDTINGIGSKMDAGRTRDDSRYRKMSMAMVALSMALPAGNPHRTDVKNLVDSLAKENGG